MSDVVPFPPKPSSGAALTAGGPPQAPAAGAPPDMPSPEFADLDVESLFNIRGWVQSALEAKGAKCVGAGIGVGGTIGVADVQIELEGCQYNIGITPLSR